MKRTGLWNNWREARERVESPQPIGATGWLRLTAKSMNEIRRKR
jgi:hypothetical protein